MVNKTSEITPDEIRNIREGLGLTQVEAGELIGGGPRAFTKYESGDIRPSAAARNLLRLLRENPSAISILGGRAPLPVAARTPSPFEVDGSDIGELDERMFPQLLRHLLNAEAWANDLPCPVIHVASNIHAPDGGEDGRIMWQGGPSATLYLPSRLCQFQLKTRTITPSKAAKDVSPKRGSVKEMVRSVLADGAHYLMLCTHPYPRKQIEDREARIREALEDAGLIVAHNRIEFRDADQIAAWVNHYPPVAVWVKEKVRPGTIGCFSSWDAWATRPEHLASPWVSDERLPELLAPLRQRVAEPREVVRVVGLSGVGKSRLTLEALRSTAEDRLAGRLQSDTVMYAVLSESSPEHVMQVVQRLAGSGKRALVVVDNCDPETHQVLTGMVLREESRLSLVTIGDEVAAGANETALKVDEAPASVVEPIIAHISPSVPVAERQRLLRFSSGFPKIAIGIGRTWDAGRSLIHATDDNLVDAFVLGRKPQAPELLLKSAMLLAAFGLVRMEPKADDQVASFGRQLSAKDLYAGVTRLVARDVVQRRGRYAILQPLLIAMKLAERQWSEWDQETWDMALSGDANSELTVLAARRLALLNTTAIAQRVVDHVCRHDGPFDSVDGIVKARQAAVLSALAEIDPARIAYRIDQSLGEAEALGQTSHDTRRHLVEAAAKISFHSESFAEGARLLLRLAVTENETWRDDASRRFKSLFPIILGSTEADGDARLSFLDEAADTRKASRRALVVDSLGKGCKMGHYSRLGGAETQGSRPELHSWRPSTSREAYAYIEGCVTRLAIFAVEDDELGVKARIKLSEAIQPLLRRGRIDTVETVVRKVASAVGGWVRALRRLKAVLAHDVEQVDAAIIGRIESLITDLQPTTLEARVRTLISEVPMPGDRDYRVDPAIQHRQDVIAVRTLADELIRTPSTLLALLPTLSRGPHWMAPELGEAIAACADSPLEWLEPIVRGVAETPERDRNYGLLAGFAGGLADRHPNELGAFKNRAALSPDLGPAFPLICVRLGVTVSDIQLAIAALEQGSLSPQQLSRWAQGRQLARLPTPAVAALLSTMLDHSAEGFTEAIMLMGVSFDVEEIIDNFRIENLKTAENATRWKLQGNRQVRDAVMSRYFFEETMGRMLNKGRDDPDARAVVLALSRGLSQGIDGTWIEALLPKLLSCFPEISWPLIGQAIVSDKRRASRIEYLLGDHSSFGKDPDPAILHLPEDVLLAWCHAHPDRAPAFAAKIVPFLSTRRPNASERQLHPAMARVLDRFGDRKDVQEAAADNIHTYSWTGSPATYYALYVDPLTSLCEHPKSGLRDWAKRKLCEIRTTITRQEARDQEREAHYDL